MNFDHVYEIAAGVFLGVMSVKIFTEILVPLFVEVCSALITGGAKVVESTFFKIILGAFAGVAGVLFLLNHGIGQKLFGPDFRPIDEWPEVATAIFFGGFLSFIVGAILFAAGSVIVDIFRLFRKKPRP